MVAGARVPCAELSQCDIQCCGDAVDVAVPVTAVGAERTISGRRDAAAVAHRD